MSEPRVLSAEDSEPAIGSVVIDGCSGMAHQRDVHWTGVDRWYPTNYCSCGRCFMSHGEERGLTWASLTNEESGEFLPLTLVYDAGGSRADSKQRDRNAAFDAGFAAGQAFERLGAK